MAGLDAKFKIFKTITSNMLAHEVLNLYEIKKLIVQFVYKLRDESNEPNQIMIR